MRRFQYGLLAAVAAFGFASAASAADLPVKAPVAPVAAPYNWTGFYVGANIGGGWGHRQVDNVSNDPGASSFFTISPAPTSASFHLSGVVGGLQLGYNWQLNRNWLVGLETDFDGSSVQGSSSNALGGTFLAVTSFEEKIKWFGTVRGRLGYLPIENLLAYVTGGFAYGKVDHSGTYSFTQGGGGGAGAGVGGFSVICGNPATCFSGSSSDTATGWTAGGGLEYALGGNFTVRAEYLYISLASKSVTEMAVRVAPGNSPASFNANFDRTNFNVARLGVNYRF